MSARKKKTSPGQMNDQRRVAALRIALDRIVRDLEGEQREAESRGGSVASVIPRSIIVAKAALRATQAVDTAR